MSKRTIFEISYDNSSHKLSFVKNRNTIEDLNLSEAQEETMLYNACLLAIGTTIGTTYASAEAMEQVYRKLCSELGRIISDSISEQPQPISSL